MGDLSWRYDIANLASVFSDIEPLPVGDDGVAAIDYPTEFRTAYGYLGALIAKDERSERALRLTATCLQLNPGNYTVWQYRRRCIDKTDPLAIAKELKFTSNLGGNNPKNYQIWHHRRALLELCHTEVLIRQELEYISLVLSHDSKNYHAWSHRMWVAGRNDALWGEELVAVDVMIREDARNNSAWNYRWVILHNGGKHALSPAQAMQEVDYVVASIKIVAFNESTWRYLVALTKEQRSELVDDTVSLSSFVDFVLDRIRNLSEDLKTDNPQYMGAMVDMLEIKADHSSLMEARDYCEELSQKIDAIRAPYWDKRLHDISLRIQNKSDLN